MTLAPLALPRPFDRLRLPVIGSPMFLVSRPPLVLAQCKAGIVGAFPSLNARPASQYEEWLHEVEEGLAAHDRAHPESPAAPFAVNLIVHKTNQRLEEDLALTVKHRVPIVITSLGAREDVIQAVHGYGGLVLHDIIHVEHARKAAERGADGLIAVAAGAGGHAGRLSPFALAQEIRAWWKGLLVMAGAINSGSGILAAQAMGADLAYLGSAFIPCEEASADPRYKEMVVAGQAADVVYTDYFSGVPANYLKASMRQYDFDPDNLPATEKGKMDFGVGSREGPRAWRDIWSAGQGIGGSQAIEPTAGLVERLAAEYAAARRRLCA